MSLDGDVSAPAPSRRALVPRALAFVLVLLWLAGGPLLRQGLDRSAVAGVSVKRMPLWVMFGGAGVGLTQVRFELAADSGDRQPVDVYDVLHLSIHDQPRGVWRVHGLEEATALGKRLCRELEPAGELYMVARTATRRGWRDETVDGAVCETGRRR